MNSQSFGHALLERGLISSRQFQEATQSVVLFGGRLGTHLVASRALDEETVEQALADHLGVARAPAGELEQPDPEALGAIPRELVERFRLLAFRREGETLHVAMTDPWDCEAAEVLLLETGLRVLPYVVSETRMQRLLRDHFDETLAERRALGIDALAPDEELMDAESFASLSEAAPAGAAPARAPAAALRTPVAPSARASAEHLEALAAVSNPWESVRLGLEVAVAFARIAAFLVVRDRIEGLQAAGAVVRRDLTGVFAGEALASPLLRAAVTGRVTRGVLCRKAERALIDALGSPAGQAVVFPVKVQSRVVNLLYVEDLIGGPPDAVCRALAALAARIGQAYEAIIRDRKAVDPRKDPTR